MTDARLPGRWVNDIRFDGLTDRAWRTFTYSLMWCNEHGTDGFMPRASMRFLHPQGVDGATIKELVDAKLWRPVSDGLMVPGWEKDKGQELAITVETRRENNRQRQKKLREGKKKVTGDVTRDVTQTPEDRTGQARQGQAAEQEVPMKGVDSVTGELVDSWPVREIPGSERGAA